MAPTKRARPSFSPPRPGKSKPAVSSKSKNIAISKRKTPSTSRGGKRKDQSKYAGRQGTRQAILDDDDDDNEDQSEEEIEARTANKRRKEKARSALDLVDMEASEEEEEESEESNDGDDDYEDERTTNQEQTHLDMSSPEPDMILAEVTVAPVGTSDAQIPPQLVHKIIQHHFERGEVTKMGRDARDLVTEYIELFVREAVLRSNNERMAREGTDEGGGVLEVEDLERSAVQLALDF